MSTSYENLNDHLGVCDSGTLCFHDSDSCPIYRASFGSGVGVSETAGMAARLGHHPCPCAYRYFA